MFGMSLILRTSPALRFFVDDLACPQLHLFDYFSLSFHFLSTVSSTCYVRQTPKPPTSPPLTRARSPKQTTMSPSKQPTCGTNRRSTGEAQYNTPLHVGALFAILAVSTTACAFPMLVHKFPALRIPASILFAIRHFGTGVLLATAFVHLLPTAFVSLGDGCLGDFWTTDYPAMPGAIVLAAIFFISTVEMALAPAQQGHGGKEEEVVGFGCTERKEGGLEGAGGVVDRDTYLQNLGPLSGRCNSVGRRLADMGERDGRVEFGEGAESEQQCDKGVLRLSAEQEHRKALLQCMLLEMGILFHSVFIGMALSVSVGKEFVILLIAIIFHQTFEGLALGSRIAALKWERNAVQPWVMSLAYGCTYVFRAPLKASVRLILV